MVEKDRRLTDLYLLLYGIIILVDTLLSYLFVKVLNLSKGYSIPVTDFKMVIKL